MAIHNVFLGGNARTGYERHSFVSGASDDLEVRYEGLLLNRHIVLPFEFDGGLDGWRNYFSMEGEVKADDDFRTHLIGRHANIKKIVFHNKSKSGVRDKNNPATITTPTKVELSVVDKTGAPILGTSAVEIDLSEIGTTVLDATGKVTVTAGFAESQLFTTENAFINVKFKEGSLLDACFSVFVELVDFMDVRGCTCAPMPCEVEYPQPNCPPFGIKP